MKLAKNIKAPLKVVPCPTGVFEHVAIDLFGPLPVSQKGNKYGCLMVDRTSGYVECAPIPNKAASTVARAINYHILKRYGPPRFASPTSGPRNRVSQQVGQSNVGFGRCKSN